MPYLLDYRVEQRIYQAQIERGARRSGKHVAPHTAYVARAVGGADAHAQAAGREVPQERWPRSSRELAPLEKAELYADGATPEGLTTEQAARARRPASTRSARESDSYPNYEGRTGASPREMKLLLMNAAQSPQYACLSPLAVFDEMEELVRGRDRLRVPQAGAAAGRLPREQEVHRPGARRAARSHRRRGAHVDGPRRGAALHEQLRALRHARLALGQEGEGPQPASPAATRIPTRR